MDLHSLGNPKEPPIKDWGHGTVPDKDLGYTEHQTPALSPCMASELCLGWGQHNCGGTSPAPLCFTGWCWDRDLKEQCLGRGEGTLSSPACPTGRWRCLCPQTQQCTQCCQGLIRCHSLSGAGHLFGFGLCWDTESRLVPLPRVMATVQQYQAGQGLRAVLCGNAFVGLWGTETCTSCLHLVMPNSPARGERMVLRARMAMPAVLSLKPQNASLSTTCTHT